MSLGSGLGAFFGHFLKPAGIDIHLAELRGQTNIPIKALQSINALFCQILRIRISLNVKYILC